MEITLIFLSETTVIMPYSADALANAFAILTQMFIEYFTPDQDERRVRIQNERRSHRNSPHKYSSGRRA